MVGLDMNMWHGEHLLCVYIYIFFADYCETERDTTKARLVTQRAGDL